MIADWVKQTSTTTGTGTLDLDGTVSGFAEFADVLTSGMVVRYQILDANGTSRENGYGTFTNAATDTLSRDTVIATLVGGTYDASSPAALTLTSGTHTVMIAPVADAFVPVPMGIEDGDVTSAHMGFNPGAKSRVLTANAQQASPFLLDRTINCTQIGMYCDTGVDATTSNIAISQLVNGISTAYIQSASIDLTTTNSAAMAYANITDTILHPGWYLCHVVSSGAVTLGCENDTAAIGRVPLPHINTTSRNLPASYMTYTGPGSGALKADPTTGQAVSTAANPVIFYLTAG